MKRVTYTNQLRVDDKLPEGVQIINDRPVLQTKSGQLPIQEGDIIIYQDGKEPYIESPNMSQL